MVKVIRQALTAVSAIQFEIPIPITNVPDGNSEPSIGWRNRKERRANEARRRKRR